MQMSSTASMGSRTAFPPVLQANRRSAAEAMAAIASIANRSARAAADATPEHWPGVACIPSTVLAAAAIWEVPKQRTLLADGSLGDCCYGVRTGMLNLVHAGSGASSTLLDVLEPGQWIAADDLMAATPSSFSAETACDASLFVLRRTRMLQLMDTDPAVRAWLFASATARVQRIAERLHVLTARSPDERVQWALETLLARFGQAGPLGRTIAFRINQTQLACIAGTARQTVNRVMQQMREAGTLDVIRGRIAAPQR